jgi:iron-regulated transporter 1
MVSAAFSTAYCLYFSYFFAAFGDRMWEFASVVFLLDLFPDTLLPPSLLGLIENSVGILLSGKVGAFIDTNNRLITIRYSILGQNLACFTASLLLFFGIINSTQWSQRSLWGIFSILVLCACLAKLSSSMNKIALYKDWLIVIAAGDTAYQTKLNATMRRIDLICSTVAPLFVGIISTATTSSAACLFIAAWSGCSIFVEYWLNLWVYNKIPALHNKAISVNSAGGTAKLSTITIFQQYFNHPVLLASLSYCCLYISALSFGGIMISWLKTEGLSDAWLSAGRAIAAVVGVLGTLITPIMVRKLELTRAGTVSIFLQLICLLPLMFGFIFLGQSSLNFMILVFFSICASRFGLWGFDLCETQLMQERVQLEKSGIINGAQESLMNGGYLLSFVLTIVFSEPQQFIYPAFISFGAVLLATILYAVYDWNNRHRLDADFGTQVTAELSYISAKSNSSMENGEYHMHLLKAMKGSADEGEEHIICEYHKHDDLNASELAKHLSEAHLQRETLI